MDSNYFSGHPQQNYARDHHGHLAQRGRAVSMSSRSRGSSRTSRTSSVSSHHMSLANDEEADDEPCDTISSTSSQFSSWSARPQKKRKCADNAYRKVGDEDGDDDDDEEEEYDTRDRHDERQELPLACPFHKREPTKFCVQLKTDVDEGNKTARQYRICAGPGFYSIQRLREHLKRKHSPVQCDRCYMKFLGKDRAKSTRDLQCHRQSETSCPLKPESLREGISDAQWATLDKRIKAKKTRAMSRINRYWVIWDELFPGVKRPDTPWHEAEGSIGRDVPGQETFRMIFGRMLEFKLNSRDISFSEGNQEAMKDRTITLAEQAYKVFVAMEKPAVTSEGTTRSNETVKPSSFMSRQQSELATVTDVNETTVSPTPAPWSPVVGVKAQASPTAANSQHRHPGDSAQNQSEGQVRTTMMNHNLSTQVFGSRNPGEASSGISMDGMNEHLPGYSFLDCSSEARMSARSIPDSSTPNWELEAQYEDFNMGLGEDTGMNPDPFTWQ